LLPDSSKTLSDKVGAVHYQFEEEPLSLTKADFVKTVTDRIIFEESIDIKVFSEAIAEKLIYSSNVTEEDNKTFIEVDHGV